MSTSAAAAAGCCPSGGVPPPTVTAAAGGALGGGEVPGVAEAPAAAMVSCDAAMEGAGLAPCDGRDRCAVCIVSGEMNERERMQMDGTAAIRISAMSWRPTSDDATDGATEMISWCISQQPGRGREFTVSCM
jgi:hypothetical protein